MCLRGTQTVFASDDVVFAWAIGKALLIVIVSFGTLVYVAWAATYQKTNATHVGISNNSALKYKLPLKRATSCSLQTDHLKRRKGHTTFWLGHRQKDHLSLARTILPDKIFSEPRNKERRRAQGRTSNGDN